MTDVKGIPDVDLGPVMDDLKNQEEKGKGKSEEVKAEETKQIEQKIDLAQFKTPEDLLKGYKELQAAFTKTSQTNKELNKRIKDLEEEVALSRTTGPKFERSAEFDTQYMEDPQAAIHNTILRQRIVEVLEDEQEKNPRDFHNRYAYAQRVIQQYPNLAQTARGIQKAFALGDKLKKEALKENTSEVLESVFGEPLSDEEIGRLRKLVKGDKDLKTITNKTDAYMPDTSTSTTHTSETETKPSAEMKINESVQKGDVDGVLEGIFQDIMAE